MPDGDPEAAGLATFSRMTVSATAVSLAEQDLASQTTMSAVHTFEPTATGIAGLVADASLRARCVVSKTQGAVGVDEPARHRRTVATVCISLEQCAASGFLVGR